MEDIEQKERYICNLSPLDVGIQMLIAGHMHRHPAFINTGAVQNNINAMQLKVSVREDLRPKYESQTHFHTVSNDQG